MSFSLAALALAHFCRVPLQRRRLAFCQAEQLDGAPSSIDLSITTANPLETVQLQPAASHHQRNPDRAIARCISFPADHS